MTGPKLESEKEVNTEPKSRTPQEKTETYDSQDKNDIKTRSESKATIGRLLQTPNCPQQ